MPRFLITVIIISIAFILGFIAVITKTAPDSTKNITLFFIFLWASLTFSLSIPIYLIKYKLAPRLANLRTLYRSAFKISVFASTSITGIGLLKVLGALTPLNTILAILFLGSVYKLLSKA